MSTKVTVVVDALASAFAEAVPSATVLDGPAGARLLGSDVISVALGADDLFSAEIIQDRLPGMGAEVEESFSITCAVSSSTGGSTFKPARDNCLSMLDAIRARLRADETLGGVVQLAWMHVRRLSQGLDSGAYADITFTVEGRDYL